MKYQAYSSTFGRPLNHACYLNDYCRPRMWQDKLRCDRKHMGFYRKYMKWFWSHGCAMSMSIRGKQIALVTQPNKLWHRAGSDPIPLARMRNRGVASNIKPNCSSARHSVPQHQSLGVLNDWTSQDASDKHTIAFSNYSKHQIWQIWDMMNERQIALNNFLLAF